MKMYSATAALAAATLWSLPVLAQDSQVTLFGTVDVGAAHLRNAGGSTTGMSHSGANVSRIGVRGEENLGSGYSAGFWFESGMNPKTGGAGGPTGAFFNRRATVSIHTPYGEVRLGRDDAATFLNTLVFDPFMTNGVAGTNTFLMNGAPIQINSALSYFLPKDLGGVYGQAQYAWGPAAVPGSKTYQGARIGYASSAFNVAVALGQLGFEDRNKLKIANVGASYDFGVVKPSILWAQEKRSGGAAVRGLQLGASATLGAHWLRASVGDYRASGTDHIRWRKFGLGYGYNLSKRTLLYTSYSFLQNRKGAARAVSTQGLTAPTNAANHSASGVEIGLRHFF